METEIASSILRWKDQKWTIICFCLHMMINLAHPCRLRSDKKLQKINMALTDAIVDNNVSTLPIKKLFASGSQ